MLKIGPRGSLTKREPSSRLKHNSMTTSSSLPRISEILPAIHLQGQDRKRYPKQDLRSYFFMTSTLTFCISTFWLNSGGNLVDLRSFASTVEAMPLSKYLTMHFWKDVGITSASMNLIHEMNLPDLET